MRWILMVVIFLLAFPLRKAFIRNWRATIPACAGAFFGYFLASTLEECGNVPAYVKPMWTVIGAGFFALWGREYLDRLFPPNQGGKR
jgi:hypothetical protein